jgi:hypothetical protein
MSFQSPSLFATPETRAAVERAHSLAILVGGYDGSGNYGDIAQLDASLQLLSPLREGILVLPVLERTLVESDRELRDEFIHAPEHPIFFGEAGDQADGLVPLATPAALVTGAIYLYGGGYLNPSWGERKLAMLSAAERFLDAAAPERTARVASGLQVDPGWLEGLPRADAEALARFDFLGARDGLSATALERLAPDKPVHETSDDAAAVIPAPVANDPWEPSGPIEINFHVAGHEWVTPEPEETFSFAAGLAHELGRQAGRPVVARPLIAYLDGRVDERAAVERLRAACADHEIKVDDPSLLRPVRLPEMSGSLRAAGLTISCSYHVALTSLLLGIPTAIFSGNDYYRQKAAGLAEAFELPSPFVLSAGDDPKRAAEEIAAAVDASGGAGELRRRLYRRADRFRMQRREAEELVLAHLTGAAITALGRRIDDLTARLRERSAEPAALQAELAALRDENEALRQPAVEAAVQAAEQRAERAEVEAAELHRQLAELLGSSTWKLGEPLRRLGGLRRDGRTG